MVDKPDLKPHSGMAARHPWPPGLPGESAGVPGVEARPLPSTHLRASPSRPCLQSGSSAGSKPREALSPRLPQGFIGPDLPHPQVLLEDPPGGLACRDGTGYQGNGSWIMSSATCFTAPGPGTLSTAGPAEQSRPSPQAPSGEPCGS